MMIFSSAFNSSALLSRHWKACLFHNPEMQRAWTGLTLEVLDHRQQRSVGEACPGTLEREKGYAVHKGCMH
eukprot:scaffold24312_cov18-Tisochrysis_lutea.AAC.1